MGLGSLPKSSCWAKVLCESLALFAWKLRGAARQYQWGQEATCMRLLKAATETVGQEITKQDAIGLIRKKLLHSLAHVLPSMRIGTSLAMNVLCSALACGVLSSSLI